jgi:hypothetical protein
MLIEFSKSRILVLKEATGRKYGKKESLLYYDIKKELVRHGYDCIKKLAWKDGHLVDNHMYYLRDRKQRWFLSDPSYALRLLSEEFDKAGLVYLYVNSEENDWRNCK